MSLLESLQESYSDIYKDVHGFRPRHDTAEDWNSESFLSAQIDQLVVRLKEVIEQESQDQAVAIQSFETEIVVMIVNHGAKDRETAIRWMHQVHETDGDNERLCYKRNLPYGYFNV